MDAVYNKQTQTTLVICGTVSPIPIDTLNFQSTILEIDKDGEILKAKYIEGLKVS